MSASLILAKLSEGAHTYSQLLGICDRVSLDIALRQLLIKRKIVLLPCPNGPARYSLPIVIHDRPLQAPRKVLTLQQSIDRKRKADRDRRNCPCCKAKRSPMRYMYGGRINKVCFSCREAA